MLPTISDVTFIYLNDKQKKFLQNLYDEVSNFCNANFDKFFLTHGHNCVYRFELDADISFASKMLNVKVEFPY